MTVKALVKKVSKNYQLSEDELLKKSIKEFLINRKSEIEKDIFQILVKYQAKNLQELEKKMEDAAEHPAWEDLIVVENLNARIKEIQNDIRTVS